MNINYVKAQGQIKTSNIGLELSSPANMSGFYKYNLDYGIAIFYNNEHIYFSVGLINSVFDATYFEKKYGFKAQSRYYLNHHKLLSSYITVLNIYKSRTEEWTQELQFPNNKIETQYYLGKYKFCSFLPGYGMSINILPQIFCDIELLYGIEFYNFKSTITRQGLSTETTYYYSGNLFMKNRSSGVINFSIRWKPILK